MHSNESIQAIEQIPGYKLIRQIGEGGMATVYRGIQTSLNRQVAIKFLLRNLTNHSELIERFKRESIIIARLNHPNIIHIIDRGITTDGMPYFVMEYVEGSDLEIVINEENLDYNKKLDIVVQICKALSYAHKNGVIHRDIKPSNVLLDEEGNARVLDFGIAQFYGNGKEESKHTQAGLILGTPEYMSPEQRDFAGNVTALSDLYSLGIIMFELFTGKHFQSSSKTLPDLPEPLQNIIMGCLEHNPSNRPSSAGDIKNQLLKLLNGAHLKTGQKNLAGRGISNIKEKFALLDIIKERPYGSVYLYENRINQQLLVIKKRPGASAGFIEAKLLTRLRHKNITDILGTSKNDNFYIFVMEYLSGGSLKDRLVQPYSVDKFLTAARQICEGLFFAHINRIIHGDLRPSNILFTDKEEIKITDFGLHEHYADNKKQKNWFNPFGEPRSIHADILAAGVVFYQMLTGLIPDWDNREPSSDKSFESLPARLKQIVEKMLSRDPSRRYSSFEEITTEIDSITSARIEIKEVKTPTVIIEDKCDPLPPAEPVALPPSQTIKAVLIFILFCVTAAAYLLSTGDFQHYLDALYDILVSLFEKWS